MRRINYSNDHIKSTGALPDSPIKIVFFSALAFCFTATNVTTTGNDGMHAVRRAPGGRSAQQKVGPVRAPENKGGFRAYCWSPVSYQCQNLTPMIWVEPRANPVVIARAGAELPKSRTVLFFFDAGRKLLTAPAAACRTRGGAATTMAGPWLNASATEIGAQVDRFFKAYKTAGGHAGMMVLDYEQGLTRWQVSRQQVEAIAKDPRGSGLKKKLGFKNLTAIFRKGFQRRRWNAYMRSDIAAALNRAYFYPARHYFPRLQASNYNGMVLPKGSGVPDKNGHSIRSTRCFGNVQSPALYGAIGLLANKIIDGRPYGNSPFAVLRYEMLVMQAAGHNGLPITPWLAYESYAPSRLRKANYYRELIFQLGARGAHNFLYWNPRGANGATAMDDQTLNHCLTLLDQALPPVAEKAAPVQPVTWSSRLLVAGQTRGNSATFRITVGPGVQAVKVLPGGRVIQMKGRTGTWFTTRAGRALRFQALPALPVAASNAR